MPPVPYPQMAPCFMCCCLRCMAINGQPIKPVLVWWLGLILSPRFNPTWLMANGSLIIHPGPASINQSPLSKPPGAEPGNPCCLSWGSCSFGTHLVLGSWGDNISPLPPDPSAGNHQRQAEQYFGISDTLEILSKSFFCNFMIIYIMVGSSYGFVINYC